MDRELYQKHEAISTVISTLQSIDVDGETLEFIIWKLGMEDQMLRQLIMNNPQSDVIDLLNEKIELDNERLSYENV
jgi:hypothetical protein